MARSDLMDVIIEAENRLGAIPKGNLHKGRAITHQILTKTMLRQQLTCADLRLAISYCVREQLRIESPLQLPPFVTSARTLAASTDAVHTSIDERLEAAIAWENDHPDDGYWLTRLGRAVGPNRRKVLHEWSEAGRG